MLKKLLTLAAIVLPLGLNAQTFNAQSLKGAVSKQQTHVNAQKTQAPHKADLAANQRLVGWYDTDEVASDGLGLKNFPGNWKAATWMSTNVLQNYVGAKVVGIRFATCYAWSGGSRVFMAPVTADGTIQADVVSQSLAAVTTGWNTVMLENPYVIPENPSFMVGFDYVQGSGSTDGYPLSVVEAGSEYADLYIYTNIPASSGGSGEAWYNFGHEYGNLSVQLIVELENLPAKQIIINAVTSTNVSAPGEEFSCSAEIQNWGTEAVSSYAIDFQIDGTTMATYNGSAFAANSKTTATATFTIPADMALGNHTLTANLSTLEGAAPEYPASAEKQIVLVSKKFDRAVVIEEMTGTGCPWCPRGIAGMKKMRDTFGDQFVGIGLHQYNSSDPMYFTNYFNVGFQGAPQCALNRGSLIDPFYGSGNDICDDVTAILAELPLVGVTLTGAFNEDSTKVVASANIESLVNATNYTIAYVLIADDVHGTGNVWKQANNYAQYSASQVGNDPYLSPFCSGGQYGQSSFYYAFEDVAIASSYTAAGANQATLGALTEGGVTSSTYTLSMPTKVTLKDALNMDEIAVCAIVFNGEGKVENAAKYYLKKNTTAINDVTANGKDVLEVARYTVDGRQISAPQKGINIIKMSDGTTKKVVIK